MIQSTQPNPALYIIRGIPGSGKSSLASTLKHAGVIDDYFEADQFFLVSGEYLFDAKKLGMAHTWCQQAVMDGLSCGKRIAVSNTFVNKHSLIPYYHACLRIGIVPTEIIVSGRFKNVHGVPETRVQDMQARFHHTYNYTGWLSKYSAEKAGTDK